MKLATKPKKGNEPMTEETEVTQEDPEVMDETELDQTVAPVQYEITSYGADIDSEGFVNRLRRKDVEIPPFQRDYVWTQREASRFVESLLLGLPVPGVFLARASDSKKLLVIDGQQRLKTLQFFLDGFFNPQPDAKRRRVFDLQGVQEQFVGRTYDTLERDHRITLNDAIIHATIVRQESPEGDQSSVYHIFERLNTTGRKLSPQQIRVAIYQGFVIDTLHRLNDHNSWREIYRRRSRTLKDEELILRFLALYFFSGVYTQPMKEFLNRSLENLIMEGEGSTPKWEALFTSTIDFVRGALGAGAFRPDRAINAAVYDSVMVGTARRLEAGLSPSNDSFAKAYEGLLACEDYANLTSRATANVPNVTKRLKLATEAFAQLDPAE